MQHHKIIILGSGPAGYTAAIYAARANLQPVIIAGNEPGGQLTTTTDVDNWPALPGIMGPKLMEDMQAHAKKFGAEMLNDHIDTVKKQDGKFILHGHNTYSCDALIIATGASAKYLGLESEQKYKGKGVSACATCDGFFYKNQNVVVIGGGNTAAEEALYLSNIAAKVYMVHRRDTLRAEKFLQNKIQEKVKQGKIEMVWDHVAKEILGDKLGVNAITLASTKQKDTTKTIKCTGIFIAIGHTPNTALVKDLLTLNQEGYIQANYSKNGNFTATSVPGIFAAGDVIDNTYRQAITSAGSGCMAALDAEKYLDNLA